METQTCAHLRLMIQIQIKGTSQILNPNYDSFGRITKIEDILEEKGDDIIKGK